MNSIIDKFLDKMMEIRERRYEKRKQKMLIKAKDDNIVVDALPADEDNSGIDIKKVVESMENPENKAEVVQNNFEEIIEQNNVRDTMKHLEDDDVIELLKENKGELEERGKMYYAIQAINNDDTAKLKMTEENLRNLTISETANILKSVKGSKGNKVESKKIKLSSEQILKTLVKYGHVSEVDINSMASTLEEESSKLAIAKLCLAKISEYDEDKTRNITSQSKAKMVYNLLHITNVDDSEKELFIDKVISEKLLSSSESEMIKDDLLKEKLRKEKLEQEKRFGINR